MSEDKPLISSVKVSYCSCRWEVCVVWEGFPMVIRVGTGDTPDEAFKNAANQVIQDARENRERVTSGS